MQCEGFWRKISECWLSSPGSERLGKRTVEAFNNRAGGVKLNENKTKVAAHKVEGVSEGSRLDDVGRLVGLAV